MTTLCPPERSLCLWPGVGLVLGLTFWLATCTSILAQTRFVPDAGRGDTIYLGEVFAGQGDVVRRLTLRLQGEAGEQASINQVYSSCDCAVPSWPRETFTTGDTLTLKVIYTPDGHPGLILKTLTLYSSERKPLGRVYLKGRLIDPPAQRLETPTPILRPRNSSPVLITRRLSFNDTAFSLTADETLALRALGPDSRIIITGGASRVPSQSFGTNEALARARSRAARRVIETAMAEIHPRVTERARVAGPPPAAPAEEPRYAAFQFVLIEARPSSR